MLLEFRTRNFKSFKEELVFSMIPAPKQKGLDYSILKSKVGKKEYKGLSSAVIYGPNASGKTNIIGAMDVFKAIVKRGNIKNNDDIRTLNVAANKLELIPNSSVEEIEPTFFSVKFIEKGILFEYQLSFELGSFLAGNYPRRITSEKLQINNKLIFERKEDLKIDNLSVVKDFLINEFEKNKQSAISLAKNNLNPEELFLKNGFKMMFSSHIVNLISEWFENKFVVIYRCDAIEFNKKISESKEGTIYIENTINQAAKRFGINSNDLGYVVPEDGSDTQLCSIFKKLGAVIPAELFESYGTVRFINIFPMIIKTLVEGSTLVVDEFDASIHPMALLNIINIFHNDEINTHQAQLIFNTHNPIFLNSNIYRRDEIKFVERDEKTHFSYHYSLSDFKTSGPNGVRKEEDYMSNYFVSRYGAIKDIDFSDMLENIINKKSEG